MRHLAQIFSKILFFLFLGIVSVGGSIFLMNHVLKNQGGIGSLATMLETIRLRTTHPTMSPEKIAAEAAKKNADPVALLHTLASGNLAAPTVAAAEIQAPAKSAETVAAEIDPTRTGKVIQLNDAADGREVFGVVHQSGTEDLNAVDRINALHISDELKSKILSNYHATGVLPEIVMRDKRKPAAATGEPDTEL